MCMDIGKQYSVMYKLQAQLDSAFGSAFTKAQSAVASMQKEIQGLNKTQADISSYQKQQTAVEATKKKLETLQQQYDNIQKEIQETEGYSSSLENKLLSKQQQIDKTAASLGNQTQKLQEMEKALEEAGIDTGNLTGESAKLGTQIDELKRKQEDAAESAGAFGSAGEEAFANVKEALVAAGLVTALKEIGQAYMECVGIAGDFEEAMSTVEALSQASTQEMAALSAEAKELGASTKFTAKEAADAMGYMGMAGWGAADMLQGMDGVLQLAAASGEDLARVSDIVTDNLTAFGLKASDTAHFSDVLAAAATNANTNVSIMGETFKMSAPLAGALGYSIEDVSVAIGLMANSGIKGSLAGTSLKNVFNGLLEGVTLTSAAFGEYEFSTVNADGTMKGFGATIEELRDLFAEMTEAEKMSNAEAIAGLRGYAGLLAILNATEEDYTKLANSIDNCAGAAQRMAAIKLDNMNGQLTIAKSAWDGLKISVGEQFTPAMQKLYEIAAKVFSAINEFVKEHPGMVKGIAAFVAIIGAATAGLMAYVAAVKIAGVVTGVLGTTAGVFLGVAAAVAAVSAVAVGMASAIMEANAEIEAMTAEATELRDVLESSEEAYRETVDTSIASAQAAETYVDRLRELEAAGQASSEVNSEYQQTLALLLQTMPELSDAISTTTDQYGRTIYTLNESTEALDRNIEAVKRNAIAQAYSERLTEIYKEQADVMVEAQKNALDHTKAQERYEAAAKKVASIEAQLAQARQQSASRGYAERMNGETTAVTSLEAALADAKAEMGSASLEAARCAEAMRIDAEATQEAEAAIRDTEAAYQELNGTLEDNANANDAASALVIDRINQTGASMQTLIEKYNAAYDAAYESVTGQYEIWDQADKVVATSVGSINKNLESQTKYWDDYNANLEKLSGRTGDIEGLQAVIASFADGSPQSVNAIAGLAKATDDDLAKMVENFEKLQEAQSTTSESLAEMKTDFEKEMDELRQGLEDDISQMTLTDEAYDAARDTLQGYIDGANSMLPKVGAAYAAIGDAASRALGNNYSASHEYVTSSGTYIPRQRYKYVPSSGTYVPYATGTDYAKQGMALVGEYGPELVYMQGGEGVLNAKETKALLTNYATMHSAMDGMSLNAYAAGTRYAQQGAALVGEYGPELVYMQNHQPDPEPNQGPTGPIPIVGGGGFGGGSSTLVIKFEVHVEGNATQETIDALDAKFSELAAEVTDQVMDRLHEEQEDAERGAYR